jgi:hypothetical protein
MDANSPALSDVESSGIDAATLTACAEDIHCDGYKVWCTRVGEHVSADRDDLLGVLRLMRNGNVSEATVGGVEVEQRGDNSVYITFGGNRRACVLSDKDRLSGSSERGVIEFLELFE